MPLTQPSSTPVIVIGHINHDRIWRLNSALRPGGRISWSQRHIRLGGGGYYTARRLMELGRPVRLVASLCDDAHGRWARDILTRRHFDLSAVTTATGETDCADVLLEPHGERTILSNEKRISRSFSIPAPIPGEAFYVNGARLCDAIVQSLAAAPLVLSQFPLGTPTPRPADVMVGSKADFPDLDLETIWQRAKGIAGERLKHLALTDGPHETTLFDGATRRQIHVDHVVSTADTIGAGDSFSAALLDRLIAGDSLETAAQRAGEATADWLEQRDRQTEADWAQEPQELAI